MNFITIVLAVALSAVHGSEAAENPNSIHIGAGAMTLNTRRVAEKDNASPGALGTVFYHVGLGFRLNLMSKFYIMPNINYTPVGVDVANETATQKMLSIAFPVSYKFFIFDFKFGPGALFYILSGSAGTVELKNGSSTSTFAKPSARRVSRMFFWDAGVGASVGPFRIDADLYLLSAFEPQNRSVNLLAQLSYVYEFD